MRQQYLTLEDVDKIGKTFLVRADMNSPIDMKTGKVKSDIRIKLLRAGGQIAAKCGKQLEAYFHC